MSMKLADFVAPAEVSISNEGQLYIFISDSLTDFESSRTALNWAVQAVNFEEQENTLALTIDLSKMVKDIIAYYDESDGDLTTIPIEVKPLLSQLKDRLMEAAAIIDTVHYIESKPGVMNMYATVSNTDNLVDSFVKRNGETTAPVRHQWDSLKAILRHLSDPCESNLSADVYYVDIGGVYQDITTLDHAVAGRLYARLSKELRFPIQPTSWSTPATTGNVHIPLNEGSEAVLDCLELQLMECGQKPVLAAAEAGGVCLTLYGWEWVFGANTPQWIRTLLDWANDETPEELDPARHVMVQRTIDLLRAGLRHPNMMPK